MVARLQRKSNASGGHLQDYFAAQKGKGIKRGYPVIESIGGAEGDRTPDLDRMPLVKFRASSSFTPTNMLSYSGSLCALDFAA